MSRPLTEKEQKFAELCVELGNQSEAYRRAYDVTDKDADWIKINASKLANDTNIKLTIDNLKEELREAKKIDREKAIDAFLVIDKAYKEMLELANKPNKTPEEVKMFYLMRDLLKGSDYRGSWDSIVKMCGLNEPEKRQVETKDTTHKTEWGS